MDRARRRGQYGIAVRTLWSAGVKLLLRTLLGKRSESVCDAITGRAVHTDAVLRCSPNDGMATATRAFHQPETSPASLENNGSRGNLSEAAPEHEEPGTSGLSVPAARRDNRPSQSGVEYGHHIREVEEGFRLSDGRDGLVQSICSVSGGVDDVRQRVLRRGAGVGAAARETRNFSTRTRGPSTRAESSRLYYRSMESRSAWMGAEEHWTMFS